MSGDLELLLKLQNVDYDLGELERSKEYIPDMIENLKREIGDTERQLETVNQELSNARLEERDVNLTLKQKQDRLKELQERMMAIKTNKEYDALVSEIDKIKMDIGDLENRVVELMEIIESKEEETNALIVKAKSVKETNEKQLSSLQEQIDSVGIKISEKEKERQYLVRQVSRRAISAYERIRKGKGGAAVVAVKKRACGACYKALPPQRIQEIKLGQQIITCDSCGRMLIWTENSNG
jgi:predicted  nucleic acid-binding Zn-ribbon protein